MTPAANLSLSRYEYALQCVRRLLPTLPSREIFDIGAGGTVMKYPVEQAGCTWRGFDLVPFSEQITAWDLTFPCPVQAASPGGVLLLDVIEHLPNPGLALANIAAILPPGGRLVMTMPNPRWSRSRIHALLHGNPACFTQADLDGNGHVFTPWPHIMLSMLCNAGFEVEDYVTLDGRYGLPDGPLSIRYPVRLAHSLVLMLIERLDPSACGMSYGLVARKPA